MTTKKHWAADETARDRVKSLGATHGLDSNGILEILEVKKITDFKGTEAEAVAAIVQWAQDNAPPEPEPEPPPVYEPVQLSDEDRAQYDAYIERVGSVPVWIRMDGRGYYEVSVQAWLPPVLTRVGLAYARQALEDYQDIFADVLIPANGNGGSKQATLALVPPSGNGDNTFQATHLKADTINDKTYWSVLGPRFPKHGVRIWPEVLEAAGFKEADLNTTQPVVLNGYTATYVEKDKDGKMVTDKVISLTKAA